MGEGLRSTRFGWTIFGVLRCYAAAAAVVAAAAAVVAAAVAAVVAGWWWWWWCCLCWRWWSFCPQLFRVSVCRHHDDPKKLWAK